MGNVIAGGTLASAARVFISYASADDRKRKALSSAFESAVPPITPIVVAARREPGRPLSEKVAACILEADFLVPILTRESIHTQWVNQEIGYAFGLTKSVVPIVERDIMGELKGFVHGQNDLPFSFESTPYDMRREAIAFRRAYRQLVEYLHGQQQKQFQSSISPGSLQAGDPYVTTVAFRGTVLNGFFDNYVVHVGSDFRTWNWDPDTLPPEPGSTLPSNATPGVLNGSVDIKKSYAASTKGWPTGMYKIYVRLYSHPVPGERGRTVVAENEHLLAVR